MKKLLIIGCSNRKLTTGVAIPALDLYKGGVFPDLRPILDKIPKLKNDTYIISAKYGLLHSSDLIMTYDQVMTTKRAEELKSEIGIKLRQIIKMENYFSEILLIVEPIYLITLSDIFIYSRIPISWEPNVNGLSQYAKDIINSWTKRYQWDG